MYYIICTAFCIGFVVTIAFGMDQFLEEVKYHLMMLIAFS
ncbi:hypothetical protein SAMN05443144_1512 [Fodinibius roseus]|uniref:Uncharacterized protein n=1 Tax=Fodinibius roseus TaxID=1194090 RepID=A0A1M5M4Q2_9BACT|nr:hypothetical protein SAMN05443144_1512 [Fodinibius roseus]